VKVKKENITAKATKIKYTLSLDCKKFNAQFRKTAMMVKQFEANIKKLNKLKIKVGVK
jgi:hypothetical protein